MWKSASAAFINFNEDWILRNADKNCAYLYSKRRFLASELGVHIKGKIFKSPPCPWSLSWNFRMRFCQKLKRTIWIRSWSHQISRDNSRSYSKQVRNHRVWAIFQQKKIKNHGYLESIWTGKIVLSFKNSRHQGQWWKLCTSRYLFSEPGT